MQAALVAAVSVLSGAEKPATLRVHLTIVLVPAHVTDAIGAPVTNLTREQFRLTEDGAEQKISYFAKDDAPVSVGLFSDRQPG